MGPGTLSGWSTRGAGCADWDIRTSASPPKKPNTLSTRPWDFSDWWKEGDGEHKSRQHWPQGLRLRLFRSS